MKDGTQIKTTKSLNSAKAIANQKKAEVFYAGELIYKPERYRLKALMNVRKAPSFEADVIDRADKDTLVEVLEIRNDWMKVRWKDEIAYIFYRNGEFAEHEEH